MNNLPSCWQVQNDGSQLFKDTVVKYLNDNYDKDFDGLLNGYYYGCIDNNNIVICINNYPNVIILTLQEFIDLTTNIKLPTKWCISRTPDTAKVINDWFNKNCNTNPLRAKFTCEDDITNRDDQSYLHYPKVDNRYQYDYIKGGYTKININQFKQIINMSNKPQGFHINSDKSCHLESIREALIDLGWKCHDILNFKSIAYCGIGDTLATVPKSTADYSIFNLPQDYNNALDFAKEQLALIKPTEVRYTVKHINEVGISKEFEIIITKQGNIEYAGDIVANIVALRAAIAHRPDTGYDYCKVIKPTQFQIGCKVNITVETLQEIIKLYDKTFA